jgi:hypothetical protein
VKRASGWLGATKITGTVNVRYVRQGGPLWCAALVVLAGCFTGCWLALAGAFWRVLFGGCLFAVLSADRIVIGRASVDCGGPS